MEIKVLGTGCSSCKQLFESVNQAVKELGLQVEVEKVEDLMQIMSFNVMSTPALVVDGKVVSSGKKLTKEQVKSYLTK